ncbi:hypothetical protein EIN_027070 [Entamoeba invadens IP1]|uniref:hypothetical protein n=1 Tax=Entamoeba invadens IP1 TaxID=370355 RepID=UPI0002C3E5B5|nr:hypothetical protein EIN_027070 [Entamoeba invadens IP1]ELP90818.1 hypothetical protein EIN_027070 [Entamoeba invadens IP1]|eukprot:XP_004257589.1 hypothetical protein EIN_027070 [Entamoeba invadens IP1]
MQSRCNTLSTLLEKATNDFNTSPNYILFSKLAHFARGNLVTRQHLAQLISTKLKAHLYRFVSSLEVFYTLCLVEYLVVNVNHFEAHVIDPSFVCSIEKIAQLDKLVGFFKQKATMVQLKAMNFIQLMQMYPTNDSYSRLFETYTKMGVVFPQLQIPAYPEITYKSESLRNSITMSPLQDTPFVLDDNSPLLLPSMALLPKPPLLRNKNLDFSKLPESTQKVLEKISEFREISKEPLKKSNLVRNGVLQLGRQLKSTEAFFNTAFSLQNEFKKETLCLVWEDEEEETSVAIKEEGRKIGHIVGVLRNEVTHMKRVCDEIENFGSVKLIDEASRGVDSLLIDEKNPSEGKDTERIAELIGGIKATNLSRDNSATDSFTETATESISKSTTPSSSKMSFKNKIDKGEDVEIKTFKKNLSFKGGFGLLKYGPSVDTSRLYNAYL